jgi:VIT1/CCC1 family predicted Fe2+/Mn2+ transporter
MDKIWIYSVLLLAGIELLNISNITTASPLLLTNTDYPKNNSLSNILYASYDFITATIAGFIPYVPTFIGIGLLLFVIGALMVVMASIIYGVITALTKRRK